ncbi:MAG: HPr(Ser) kinase/phosphatase [Clostridiales bacterium]|nr:HPr(Ser) kinase/phosphatase [Clostridiales bacterium]
MQEKYSISLESLMREFALEPLALPTEASEIMITSNEVNRPVLPLIGFFELFDAERIQIFGKGEVRFLNERPRDAVETALDAFFATHPPAVVVTSSLELPANMLSCAEKYDVPLLRTAERTSEFMAALIAYLNVMLAPRITRHGVLVEVYGEGVLILGDSGVGKSETAIELVKRGHRLIADDAVEIKRVSAKSLVGSAPEIIRHYVELRGIGIVDVRRLFGMGAVKDTEKIDLVVTLEPWVQGKMYDRLGLEPQTTEILGIELPSLTIPVRPGRNLAVVLEIAAMNNRQKRMGYNTAEEFNKRLMGQFGMDETDKNR